VDRIEGSAVLVQPHGSAAWGKAKQAGEMIAGDMGILWKEEDDKKETEKCSHVQL